MPCKNCKTKPVIQLTNNNVKLCKSCFIRYFEKKVLKTIRKFQLLDKEDNVAVALSGGKDSLTVLYILNKLASTKRNLKLTAILIDEGIKGYREHTIKDAKKFCKENKIPLKIYSFKKEFKYPLDTLIKKINEKSCTICGVLRRVLLNKKSRALKVKKLATGHNLDDEAQSILMNQFKRNMPLSARLGPKTGVMPNEKFIIRIKPLYLMTELETATYAHLRNLTTKFNECKYVSDSLRDNVREFLNNFEERYPGTKNAIIQSFLEILPLLKEHYAKIGGIKYCKNCEEPCSSEICRTCKLLEKIR